MPHIVNAIRKPAVKGTNVAETNVRWQRALPEMQHQESYACHNTQREKVRTPLPFIQCLVPLPFVQWASTARRCASAGKATALTGLPLTTACRVYSVISWRGDSVRASAARQAYQDTADMA